MAATIENQTAPVRGQPESTGQRAADVFVVFGITGDLAKVMTFRSLYRLERRGLLQCPIVGVAVDDWTLDQLVQRARESIEGTGESIDPDGLRPLHRATVVRAGRLRRPSDLPAGRRRDQGRRLSRLLPGDPAVPVRHGRQGPGRGGPDNDRPCGGGEAVRTRPGLRACAGRGAAPVHRRVPAVPDRPLPGKDGPGGDPATCGSPTRCSSRSGTATTSSACRSPWRRTSASRTEGTSTIPSARCATWWSTTSCRSYPPPPWRHPLAVTRRRSRTPRSRCSARSSRPILPLRPRPVRRAISASTASPPDSTTETYAALRLDIENWRWSGVPFFIRTGKRLPVTQTELRLVFKQPPRLGFGLASAVDDRSRTSSSSSSIHRPESGSSSTPGARTSRQSRGHRPRHGVRGGGRRRAHAVRGVAARCDGRPEYAVHPPGRGRGDLADHAAAAGRAAPGPPVRSRVVGAVGCG